MRFSPLFAKEGKGRFSDGMTIDLCCEFLSRDTRSESAVDCRRLQVPGADCFSKI